MSRKPISKKTRFEVFKRDKFTCQYCGASAPEIVLELDHIIPVASGGDSDLIDNINIETDIDKIKEITKINSNFNDWQSQIQELSNG